MTWEDRQEAIDENRHSAWRRGSEAAEAAFYGWLADNVNALEEMLEEAQGEIESAYYAAAGCECDGDYDGLSDFAEMVRMARQLADARKR